MNRTLLPILFLLTLAMTSGCSTPLLGLKKYEAGDIPGAKSILEKACAENDRAACFRVSRILDDEDNFNESFTFLQKSCELNNLRSCSYLAERYLKLDKIKEARDVLEKNQKINFKSSYNYAYLLYAEKKPIEAKKILFESCNEQNKVLCGFLANTHLAENDLVSAKKYFLVAQEYEDVSQELGFVEQRLRNYKQAKIEINKACDQDFGFACRIKTVLALEKSNLTFEKSYSSKCAQFDGEACYNLGLHYLLKNNLLLSEQFFEKGCKVGNGNACLEKLNRNRLTGLNSELVKIANESCDKGSGSGCELLYAYYKGNDGVNITTLEKACSLGKSRACLQIANIHIENDRKSDAFKMYDKACQLGLKKSCFYFEYQDREQNIQEVAALKYCKQGIEAACQAAGYIYNSQENFPLAIKFYQQSCDLKNISSCSFIVELQSKIDKNFNKIIPYSKLCEQGYFKACGYAANLLEEGKEKDAAKKLYERGCYFDDSRSCDSLGWLYSEEKNDEKAKYYFRQGCDLGSSYGCEQLATM